MITAAARDQWQVDEIVRSYQPGETPGRTGACGEAWLSAIRAFFPIGGGHLDLGCGTGRMTFALSDLWRAGGWSIGADLNEESLRAARERARREGLAGTRFIRRDIEKEGYASFLSGRVPDLVTAHLCMGPEIVEHAAAVLPAGGAFAGVALHPDLWKETGRSSRFAMSAPDMETLLHRFGLQPIFLRREKEVIEFKTAEDALEMYLQNGRAVPAWLKDGRWDGIRQYFSAGGRTITPHAQVQCVARKKPA